MFSVFQSMRVCMALIATLNRVMRSVRVPIAPALADQSRIGIGTISRLLSHRCCGNLYKTNALRWSSIWLAMSSSPIHIQAKTFRALPRQRHLEETLSPKSSHLPDEIATTDPAPVHGFLQNVHGFSTSRFLRRQGPKLLRDQRGRDEHLVDRRLLLALRLGNRVVAVLYASVQDAFVG